MDLRAKLGGSFQTVLCHFWHTHISLLTCNTCANLYESRVQGQKQGTCEPIDELVMHELEHISAW